MKGMKPSLVNFSGVVFEILCEEYGWHWIPCDQMPDCDCGEMHLVPPLEEMVGMLEEGEAAAFHIENINEDDWETRERVATEILNLLEDLRVDFQLTLVLVSHDLSVVRHMTDRVLVMQRGRIVEEGSTREVFGRPRHAYTRLLLDSIPRLKPQASRR